MSRKGDHQFRDSRRMFDSSSSGHGRVFHVAVVGLSGTEKDKGCLGVGKSCLCNRFIRPQADEYNRDHISILSQSDFSGPIVNNEHWLYWGETRKCTEEGFELTFSVVEQTEFVDDACFQPFKTGKTNESYSKRCSATRLNSSEKLMYICKNQLGIEKEYEQHYLPDGKFNVDGFVCVFDVSEIQGKSIARQIELIASILGSLLKTKKPVVLATTKNDESSDLYVREAEKLVTRREFKGLIPLVETSAHENVNVDQAFWSCVQRDWAKGKSKILTYHEAFQRQRNRLEIVNDAYLTLIRSNITDYRTHWNNTYSNFSQSQDFITYCDLFGQESAQQTFKRHVKKLKEEYVCRKIDMYLRRLPQVFNEMLPDLESFGPDHSWPAVQQILHQHPLFERNFVLNEGLPWQEMDDSCEVRIPFDLLQIPEAEKAFFDHMSSLLAEEHLRNLRYQFSETLKETAIAPGQPLKEIRESLRGRDCVDSLPESELHLIYEEYQKMLQQHARDQLNELFLEYAPMFIRFASDKMITQEDLAAISSELSKDERWSMLDYIPEDRHLALIRHLGFIQWPIKEHCSAGQGCVEYNIEAYHSSLSKKSSRNPIWNTELNKIQIKFVIIGTTHAENLATVVKAMCPSLEQDNPRIQYELEIAPSADNVGVYPFRPFQNNSMQSEAYLCIYSSRNSLEHLFKIMEQTLLADLQYLVLNQGGGIPLVLLLACPPETSPKERNFLREEGINRAQCFQCAFFDVTSSEPHARFKSDELLRALLFLSESVIRRSEVMNQIYQESGTSVMLSNNTIPEGALNPEIRIMLSLMCGDPISPARFLESIIFIDNMQIPNINIYPVSDHSFVSDVGYLLSINEDEEQVIPSEMPSCYVEFVVSSYHSSYAFKDELLHGNILVYWSKRQASFSNMSSLSTITAALMPIQILALVENELRPSKLSHQLVAKGQELADQLQAYFRVSTIDGEIGKSVSPFLKYALQNKNLVEKNFNISTINDHRLDDLAPQQCSPHSSSCKTKNCMDGISNEDGQVGAKVNSSMDKSEEKVCPSSVIPTSEEIYERLSDDPQQQDLKSFSNKEFDPSASVQRVGKSTHYKFNKVPGVDNDQEDHFRPMKDSSRPSEIQRHRRNLIGNFNDYYNLQSYPSADSLDRLYSINYPHESPLRFGDRNDDIEMLTTMPTHYIYRPTAHRYNLDNHAIGIPNDFGVSVNFFNHPQSTRPASSQAHVMIPDSQQPPPYSRIAISPPPDYKISQQQYRNSPRMMTNHYVNYPEHRLAHHSENEFLPTSLAYYQRKHYSRTAGAFDVNRQNNHERYMENDSVEASSEVVSGLSREEQPSISYLPNDFNDRLNDFIQPRNSPLMYATTGRTHLASIYPYHSNFSHQQPLYHHIPFNEKRLEPSKFHQHPFEHLQSQNLNRQYRRKKKQFAKTRSSSLSYRTTTNALNVQDNFASNEPKNERDRENNINNEENDSDSNSLSEKTKRSLLRSRNKKKIKDRSINRYKLQEKLCHEETRKNHSLENLSMSDNIDLINTDYKKNSENEINLKINSNENTGPRHDSQSRNDNDTELKTTDNDDDEDEIVEDSDTSAEKNIKIQADKFAVTSGWAYHQNDKSSGKNGPDTHTTHRMNDHKWPPPSSDENSPEQKLKTPGKIDLKKFNNLTNAIGRLNLNTTSSPTIKSASIEQTSSAFNQQNSKQSVQNRRQRSKHPTSKENDSESDISHSSNSNAHFDSSNDQTIAAHALSKPNSFKPASVFDPKNGPTINSKRLQRAKNRITPVPVAPLCLPSSASNSNAVTPTSSGIDKSLISFSCYDESQSERINSSAAANGGYKFVNSDAFSSATISSSVEENSDSKISDCNSGTESQQKNRWLQFSKLFSLPAGNESGFDDITNDDQLDDITSVSSQNPFGTDNESPSTTNASNSERQSKFLKSKSIGTFSELDKKSQRKADKLEKKRIKEEERKNRKNSKETRRNRSRSKSSVHPSLEDFVQSNGNPVPLFIEKCTQFIEQEGLDMEGIYRVPGNRAHVDTLLIKFDENSDVNINELDIPVNAVATALKDFFLKRLPPIFPPDSMTEIANLAKQYTDAGVLDEMRIFLNDLPKINLQIIKHMICHFIKIVEKSSVNSMDSKNIAICWWPTLLQFEFNNMDFFEQKRPHLMNFVQIMIDSFQELFVSNTLTNSSEDNLNSTHYCSTDELSSL
ncbi:Rho GTPase-activating protein [Sarcoptes scabiei]|uniref:Rho GTPase-activating protein n=1 Tax=Sarcoptes scabiei TaxID=52283 RepID=A0A834VEQ6_SARSC|nr:Rho GTPase-activating protein [Sarcoptes scabiei]